MGPDNTNTQPLAPLLRLFPHHFVQPNHHHPLSQYRLCTDPSLVATVICFTLLNYPELAE